MLFRRRRLPAGLRPSLRPDERVLAWADVDGGGTVVATTAGLHVPGDAAGARQDGTGEDGAGKPGAGEVGPGQAGSAPAAFLGWHEVHKAVWTGRQLVVTPGETVTERDGYLVTADGPAVTFRLPEPGDVPQVVRARVSRSVVYSSHHPVPGGGVRVVARRVPGVDGVSWAVRYDPGTDPADPAVRAATAELVSDLAARGDRLP